MASWGNAGATAGTRRPRASGATQPHPRPEPRALGRQYRAQSADAGAIVLNDGGRYRTAALGFGLEGLSPSARSTLIKAIFDWLMK